MSSLRLLFYVRSSSTFFSKMLFCCYSPLSLLNNLIVSRIFLISAYNSYILAWYGYFLTVTSDTLILSNSFFRMVFSLLSSKNCDDISSSDVCCLKSGDAVDIMALRLCRSGSGDFKGFGQKPFDFFDIMIKLFNGPMIISSLLQVLCRLSHLCLDQFLSRFLKFEVHVHRDTDQHHDIEDKETAENDLPVEPAVACAHRYCPVKTDIEGELCKGAWVRWGIYNQDLIIVGELIECGAITCKKTNSFTNTTLTAPIGCLKTVGCQSLYTLAGAWLTQLFILSTTVHEEDVLLLLCGICEIEYQEVVCLLWLCLCNLKWNIEVSLFKVLSWLKHEQLI